MNSILIAFPCLRALKAAARPPARRINDRGELLGYRFDFVAQYSCPEQSHRFGMERIECDFTDIQRGFMQSVDTFKAELRG